MRAVRACTAAIPGEVVDWVERLHDVVDELVAPIAAAHGRRLKCRAGCAGCCSDALSVFEVEAAVIERHYAPLLASGNPHDVGACAFLDHSGQCRIYAHRPYVCRTQGLPLRWLDQSADGEPAERRDICPLNAEGAAVENLSPHACWTLGPIEERLSGRQSALDGGEGRRVVLRSLFAGSRRRLPLTR